MENIVLIIIGIAIIWWIFKILREIFIDIYKEKISKIVEKTKWKNAFKTSSAIDEFANYINENDIHCIEIYEDKIKMGENVIL